MNCPQCQHENLSQARFCMACGSGLSVRCGKCGTELPGEARFCFACGQQVELGVSTPRFDSPGDYTPKHLAERILNSKAALEGERKQVTVLFADLKGSMELLADRDPEEARQILDPVLELMMEAVHRYEGTVNQVMGDGIMALFGAPLAHEDHAVRACYAALRMQDVAKQYAEGVFRSHGVPIQIRVGLNSGGVVVRAIGSDLHMDYTAVGQTTHLAARLEQMATPGTILLAPATLQLAEGYVQVAAKGPVAVKGLADPLEVYTLTGASALRTRLHATAVRGLTRFVGREVEIEQIRRALALAHDGHGQLVAITGEPGVGKSRLVYEFIHSQWTQDWRVLEASSVSYGKATSYLPVIDLLKAYFGVHDRDTHRDIREKVTARLLTLDRALEPIRPALLALLDVPFEDLRWQALDPPQRRRRTLDAVKELLLREGQAQPVLVVFEDLHWIDAETQALLDGLIESLPTARVLQLVSYRPEYQHAWGSKTYCTQLRIDALPPERTSELLAALLGDDTGLDPLKLLLVKRGNPFFVEETVRTLVETKALEGDRGAYRLMRSLQNLQIPATVQAILAARIDRLPGEEKHLLQTASVIGKDVPGAILTAVAELPKETLGRALGHLQEADLLYETSLFPDLGYTFKHALIHEVTYSGLLSERRRQLHAAILEALERFYGDRIGEQVERLAHHATRAQMREKAVRYLRQAGAKAVARSANEEAVVFFEQALAFLDALPATPQTLTEALDTRIALGPALFALKGNVSPEVETSYLRALDLVERLGDPSRRFPVLWGLWYLKMGRGQYTSAIDAAEHLLEVAKTSSDTGQLLEAHHALSSTLTAAGRPATALEHAEAGIALYDRERHAPQAFLFGGHDPAACCRSTLAMNRWVLGHPDVAFGLMKDALRLSDELKHPLTTAVVLWFATCLYYQRGERELTLASAERLLALAAEHGFAWWTDATIILLPAVRRERLDAEALADLHRRLVATRSPSFRQGFCLCVLAGLYADAGLSEAGLRVLASINNEGRDAFCGPEIYRIEGELFVQRVPPALVEAEQCFRRAIDLAHRLREKSLELRAALSLSRMWQHQDRQDAARQLLAPIYSWFTEGFDTADLKNARALLDELS